MMHWADGPSACSEAPPQDKREQYVKSSPITYVDQLQAPVLIIQGRNDTTDPPRQVELYVAKARELGTQVELEWYDADHIGTIMDQDPFDVFNS